MSKAIDKFNNYIMGTYGRYDAVLESGSGRNAIDENGKSYIDFGSGIGTNSLGYCDSEWVNAVCKQVQTLQHTSNYYYTKVQADAATKLCSLTGYSKVFFGNSGAEANECAIKLARKYSFDKYGTGRHNIITLKNSFHGRTLTTLSATGQDEFHNYFFPFTEGFLFAEANNALELEKMLDGTICAVMLEFIQGEGGVLPLEKDYVNRVFTLCAERDILVIADEVQTGVGRTGKFLAAEYYDVKADVTTLAKGLAGGLPVGACLANEKCANVLKKGTHGSTFGGNPISCAGMKVVLARLADKAFLEDVERKGRYIRAKLELVDEISSVSGIGLMLGIELKTKIAANVVKSCLDKGLLLLTAKSKVRLLPPLTITYEEIDKGIEILSSVLSK